MSDAIRVVIAEDSYLVREGTRRLLEDSGEVEALAAVGSADELLDAVRRLAPDAVIADIRMPPGQHMEGIVAAHAIRERHPDFGVVVLSQHARSPGGRVRHRPGGRRGARRPADATGRLTACSPHTARARRAARDGAREIDPGIAKVLFLSESTVEKHVNSIFAALGLTAEPEVNRRVAAVLAFLRDSGIATAAPQSSG